MVKLLHTHAITQLTHLTELIQFNSLIHSSSRYRWNDANLIAIAKRGLLILEETDVFLIDINIHKPAHFAVVIDQSLLNPRIAGLQLNDGLADSCRLDLDDLLIIRQLPQRGRYSYVLRHK